MLNIFKSKKRKAEEKLKQAKEDEANKIKFMKGYEKLVKETEHEWCPQMITIHGKQPICQMAPIKVK